MAILYVFNPEHDLALAANLSNFTSPHAGRKLRADLGCLPALWAGNDDYVLVENVELAQKVYSRLRSRTGGSICHFVDKNELARLDIDSVKPWGWDLALRSFLLRYGVKAVPSEADIAKIRELSHRRQAVALLPSLRMEGTAGESWEVVSLAELQILLEVHSHLVVKAPWSSSGRGVRFIDSAFSDPQARWIQNVIERQGSVVVEPYYNKVKDFGMEFESDGKGHVSYLGLSLFHTKHGAYTGNIIASEEEKEGMINRYISDDLLNSVKQKICEELGLVFKGCYQGPLGVDMMVVASEEKSGFMLHPCVEINLRRTMGHVALSIPPFADGFPRVMQIVLTDKYRIQIRKQVR